MPTALRKHSCTLTQGCALGYQRASLRDYDASSKQDRRMYDDRSLMPSRPSMRDRLEALDWVRHEMMRKGSPDFLRARLREQQIRNTCDDLLMRRTSHQPDSKRKFRRF